MDQKCRITFSIIIRLFSSKLGAFGLAVLPERCLRHICIDCCLDVRFQRPYKSFPARRSNHHMMFRIMFWFCQLTGTVLQSGLDFTCLELFESACEQGFSIGSLTFRLCLMNVVLISLLYLGFYYYYYS